MTEEQKRMYDLCCALAAQKKTGVKWLSDDIRKLADSSVAVSTRYGKYYAGVRGVKRELPLTVTAAQSAKPDSKYLLEQLDALECTVKRKSGEVKQHELVNVDSILAVQRTAQAAQTRKLKTEAAEDARLRKERAEAAAAKQRVKIKLATDFLNGENYGGAIRACREAIEGNPEYARAHYILFLADNNLKNAEAFRSGKNTHVYRYDEFREAVGYADDDEAEEFMHDLAVRISKFEELEAFKTYIQVASGYTGFNDYELVTEQIYNSLKCGKYDGNIKLAAEFFDVLISDMMPDDDKYFEYNLDFGNKVLAIGKTPSDAVVYFDNALQYHDSNEAKYKLYLAQNGFRNTAALLASTGNDLTRLDESLFKKGCNDYAVNEICAQCLSSRGSALLTAQPLFNYAISKLPKTRNKTAVNNLCGYTALLIDGGYFEQAQQQNERALGFNSDCHEALFNRVLISKKITNPLELVEYAQNIFDDPDFYAATSAYALLNKTGNIYIDIGNALSRAAKKLKDSKCRKYVLKHCKLKREELPKCDTKIDKYIKEHEEQEAQRRRREREREEAERAEQARRERERLAAEVLKRGKKKASVKSWLIAIPAIILGVGLVAAYFNPLYLFQFIHFGWIVAATVVLLVLMFILTINLYGGRFGSKLSAAKFRGFLTIAGYIVCFALMITVVVQPKTVTISNARQLQGVANLNTSVAYKYELTTDIDLSKIKSFKPIPKLSKDSTFDGKGHTISNMHVTKFVKISLDIPSYKTGYEKRKRYAAGFVAYRDGIIQNVTFKNCTVKIDKLDSYNEQRRKNGTHIGIAYGYGNNGNTSNVKYVDCQPSS